MKSYKVSMNELRYLSGINFNRLENRCEVNGRPHSEHGVCNIRPDDIVHFRRAIGFVTHTKFRYIFE